MEAPRRFVIVSQPRRGTHLLSFMLAEHPQITCYGELNIVNRRTYPPPPVAADDVRTLMEGIYRSPATSVVGFILHAYQRGNKGRLPLWDWLRHPAQWDVKILRLWREDPVAELVSRARAHAVKKWMVLNNDTIPQHPKVELAARRMTRRWRTILQEWKQAQAALTHHDVLDLSYEELTEERQETLRGVFDFLGVEYVDVEPQTQQLRTEPLATVVTNPEQIGPLRLQLLRICRRKGIDFYRRKE